MNKLIFLSLFGLLIISACNNSETKTSNNQSSDNTSKATTALPENFYKRLEGTIAGEPVVMHLQHSANNYAGVYYYKGSWMYLTVEKFDGKDGFTLYESGAYDYSNGQNDKPSTLSLKWTGDGFNGTWKDGKSTTNYPIVLKEKYPSGSNKFSYALFTDSSAAFPKKANSPAALITINYLTAKGTDYTANWLNKQIKKMLQLNESEPDWGKNLKNSANKYFSDYKKSIKESISDNLRDTLAESLNYTSDDILSILYNDNNFVVIEENNGSYSGGAHGNYASSMFCLDTKMQKRLKLDDAIKIDSNTLQRLVEQNFRKQYHIKPSEKISTVLFDDYLKPNDNFYFNSNGIAFMYNPYEVASYAQGQIVVFIPFTELKPNLVSDFASRIGIK